MEKTIIIVPDAGPKRDFLIAKIKKLYHQKVGLKWEGCKKAHLFQCRYCGQEKLIPKEICSGRILRWSTWTPSALKLLDEILSDGDISFVDLKIYKSHPKPMYKIKTYIDDKYIKIIGKSIPDVISHLWIELKAG